MVRKSMKYLPTKPWGDNSNNAIPTEKAVKKYVDNQINAIAEDDPQVGANETGYVSKWDGIALVQGSIYNDSTGNIGIGTNGPEALLDVAGDFRLENGTKVNEISTDQTLGDNSNNAIPTEKAVKKICRQSNQCHSRR